MIETHTSFFQDLTIVLGVAAVLAIIFSYFRLPVVLGYILAGFIIGPHFSPFVLIGSEGNIHTLSELGVVFLLFSLGLEFHLNKLKAIGLAAVLAGAVEIGGMMFIGNAAGRFMGWSQGESMFLGAILAISSTTIIVKVLADLKLKRKGFAQMVFGMLIVEDLAAVLLLTLLSGAAAGPSLFSAASLLTLGYLLVFLVTVLVLGLLVVPKITGFVAGFKNDELLLILVLGLCLGFCMLVRSLGYSIALGAFLMGAVLAATKSAGRIEKIINPIRDLFCAVFFVSVGLMIKPASLVENPGTVILLFLVLIAGKTLLCSLGAFIAGKDFTYSLKVGMSMAQIGEFSFVIASLGVSLGVINSSLYSIAVSVSILSTFTTPLFIRFSENFARLLLRRFPSILLSFIDLYYQWTIRFSERRQSHAVQQILRRIALKLAVFAGLIASIFLFALFLARAIPEIFPISPRFIPWLETALWFSALFGSMPIIIPAIKKIKALGMILAELGITENLAGSYYKEIRTILSNIFLLLGVCLLLLYGGLLSSTLLPTWNLLFLFAAVAGFLGYILRNAFNTIYLQGMRSLNKNLEPGDIEEVAEGLPAPSQGKEAGRIQDLHTFQITLNSNAPLTGRQIREAGLEDRGVAVLAIQRETGLVISPGQEEELLQGDSLLLMGSPSQLAEVRSLFEIRKLHPPG